MKIKSMQVQNFRLLRDSKLNLNENVSWLIGKNNTGKTSFLILLDYFYNKRRFDFNDFSKELRKQIYNIDYETDIHQFSIRLLLEIEYKQQDNLRNIAEFITDLEAENTIVKIACEAIIDKEKILELSEKGQILKTSKDLVKDPFVLEFLDIKENTDYLESDLEKNIIEHLKEFLLELGKGFSYVGNQVRLTLEEDHFYPDLVFYNRLLRCFVIIDLKIGKVSHQDIGQMQMYVNYYDREIKQEDENKTVGILLSTNKNETVVKYTLPEDNKTIFSSEYKLHMPTEQELISAVEEEKKNFELNDEI